MNTTGDPRAEGDVTEILRSIRTKGVKFWSDNGALRYKAPRGALTREDIEKLRMFSGRIVAMLQASTGRPDPLAQLKPRGQFEPVPLTFSQMIYWRSVRLSERPTLRSVTAARRLRGSLDIELFRQCLVEIVRRHEALRTRIVAVDETAEQQIVQSHSFELHVHDLTTVAPDAHAAEVERLIHEMILEPVHVGSGPLLGVSLTRLHRDVHVLAVAMEHIISDGFSMNVFLRDVVSAYRQVSRGHSLSLPAIPIQFPDYAVWQRKTHRAWLELHDVYWTRRLAGYGRLRFPRDGDLTHSRIFKVPVEIEPEVRSALIEWCRTRRTTLVMAVFTAFVAAVLRSCNASEGVIRFQSDGRFSPVLENSIGYFACVLNLRAELRPDDTFLDLLERLAHEYFAASEHADLSYLESRTPAPEYTRNSCFNWIPQGPRALGDTRPEDLQGAPTFEPFQFAFPADRRMDHDWDYEPSIALYDKGDGIRGHVTFYSSSNSRRTIEAFRDHFVGFIGELLRQPEQRVRTAVSGHA